MNITAGHEEEWLRMMLDDNDTVVKMGLPLNMTKDQKESFIKQMMEAKDSYMPTPVSAPASSNSVAGDEISYRDLKVGEKYLLTFPNGNEAEVILNRIWTNSLGNDYIFKNIRGAENLLGKAGLVESDEFPLPFQLLSSTKFNALS